MQPRDTGKKGIGKKALSFSMQGWLLQIFNLQKKKKNAVSSKHNKVKQNKIRFLFKNERIEHT